MVELVLRAWPLLLWGTLVTVAIGMASYALACIVAPALALARLYGPRPLRLAATLVVSLVCGTPVLVQILLLYYGLPQLGLVLPAVPTVVAGLALNTGAYMSEDLRGAMGAVPEGQWDAGASLGLRPSQTLLRVVAPQALRAALPTLGSRLVGLMKETSLASVVTVVELTRVAESVGSATFRYLEMFVVVAAIYWLVCAVIATAQAALERRLALPPVRGRAA